MTLDKFGRHITTVKASRNNNNNKETVLLTEEKNFDFQSKRLCNVGSPSHLSDGLNIEAALDLFLYPLYINLLRSQGRPVMTYEKFIAEWVKITNQYKRGEPTDIFKTFFNALITTIKIERRIKDL